MIDHQADVGLWTWMVDHVVGFFAGVVMAVGSAWMYLERQFDNLRQHNAATDKRLAEHDVRLTELSAHHRAIEERLGRIEEATDATRDLTMRIAGKVGA